MTDRNASASCDQSSLAHFGPNSPDKAPADPGATLSRVAQKWPPVLGKSAAQTTEIEHARQSLKTGQALETKALSQPVAASAEASDVADAFDQFMRAFETYKDANNERLDRLEGRLSPDPLTEEKLRRIDQFMDSYAERARDQASRRRRPVLAGSKSHFPCEHKQAFDRYVRTGMTDGLSGYEAKALSAGSGADGGYLVPDETEATVMMRLGQISPIRSIAGIREVSAAVYKKPFSTAGPATGWVSETAARPETTSPTLAELTYPTMELYAMPAASNTLLEDSVVDIDQWIAQEIEQAFAEQEGAAFVSGDGINKPQGFLSYPTVDETSWSWGNLGYLATGVAGDFAASNAADSLVDLIYLLKASYRQNAAFVMNRHTQAEVRKLKDADGNYIWQPPATAEAGSSLMQFPIVEAEDMPDIGTDSLSIAFGDFQRGYLIVDRAGMRILRDPYSSKPHVLFYTTKRVGGGIQDFDAIKLMKFGIS